MQFLLSSESHHGVVYNSNPDNRPFAGVHPPLSTPRTLRKFQDVGILWWVELKKTRAASWRQIPKLRKWAALLAHKVYHARHGHRQGARPGLLLHLWTYHFVTSTGMIPHGALLGRLNCIKRSNVLLRPCRYSTVSFSRRLLNTPDLTCDSSPPPCDVSASNDYAHFEEEMSSPGNQISPTTVSHFFKNFVTNARQIVVL